MATPTPTNCRYDSERNRFVFDVAWDAVVLECAITAAAVEKQFPAERGLEQRLKALAASARIGRKAWNHYKSSGETSILLTEI